MACLARQMATGHLIGARSDDIDPRITQSRPGVYHDVHGRALLQQISNLAGPDLARTMQHGAVQPVGQATRPRRLVLCLGQSAPDLLHGASHHS